MSRTRLLLGGLKSFLPFLSDYRGTGGTTTWEYCLEVWLRHCRLCLANDIGIRPGTLVEIGPGDTVGTGICAILSGFSRYVALDVLEHARWDLAEDHIDPLTTAFREKGNVVGRPEFGGVYPPLEHCSIPATWPWGTAPDPASVEFVERLVSIRTSIRSRGRLGPIRFHAPWYAETVEPGSADWIFSHVALQDMDANHEEDVLQRSLAAFHGWLRPGGVMTHQVDFSCPGGSPWNHHWRMSPLEWRIVRGRRPYYVNGLPLSRYHELLADSGFDSTSLYVLNRPGLGPADVHARYRGLPEQDYSAVGATLVAFKRAA